MLVYKILGFFLYAKQEREFIINGIWCSWIYLIFIAFYMGYVH